MKRLALFIVLFFGVALLACGCAKTADVTGKVENSFFPDKPAIEGVEVSAKGTKTTTDASGNYTIKIPAKPDSTATLSFSKENYNIPDVVVTIDAQGAPQTPPSATAGLVLYNPEASYAVSELTDLPSKGPRSGVFSPDGKYMYLIDDYLSTKQIIRLELDTNTSTILAESKDKSSFGAEINPDWNKPCPGNDMILIEPTGVDISSDGDTLYFADKKERNINGGIIRKITGVKNAKTAADVTITTIAGGGEYKLGNQLKYGEEYSGEKIDLGADIGGIELADDDTLYACGTSRHSIFKITGIKDAKSVGDTKVHIFAGRSHGQKSLDGPIEKANFSTINDLEITPDGDSMYIADENTVRKLTGIKSIGKKQDDKTPAPAIFTIAGDPKARGDAKELEDVNSITLANDEDTIFVGNRLYPKRLRKITGVKAALSAADTKISDVEGMDISEKGLENQDKVTFDIVYGCIINKENTRLYLFEYTHKVPRVVGAK